MEKNFSLEQGEKLVKLVRKSISYALYANSMLKEAAPKEFSEERGVFTTIHSFPSMNLRGCIGFPEPVMPLWNAVIGSAFSAAFNDSRFMPLQSSELDKIVLEISILTLSEEIKCSKKELPEKILCGKDGLIVKRGAHSGLLLPIVPVTYKWDSKTLLEQTCIKAGLPEAAWRSAEIQVFKFQSQVFEELSPGGEIKELDLMELLKK